MKKNTTQNTIKKDKQTRNIFIAIIIFLTIITFSKSTESGFVSFDDTGYITNNNLLKDLSITGIKAIFSTYVMGNYHPLTVLTDALIYNFSELKPAPYHIFSIMMHILNVILVFFLLRYFLSNTISIAIATCIFAVHPMHVEAVAWVSDLKDLLYSFFYLSSLIFYIKYLKSKNYSEYRFLLLSGLMFILSLLSKSAAVTLPVILFLIDYYFERKISIKMVIEKIPLFLLSITFGIVNIFSQQAAGAIVKSTTFNYADRFFMACYSLFYYVYSFFLPLKLCNLHPFPEKTNEMLPIIYYISPLIIIIIFSLIIWSIIKLKILKKEIIFGFSFFLITIFLVLQFTPFGFAVVSERYTYLPYIGLLIILGKFYTYIIETKPNLKFNINLFLIAVIFIFSIVSFQRNKVWKNSIDLITDMTIKYPKFAMAFDDLGVARMLSSDLEGAIKDFNKALEIDPKYYYSYNNRGEARRYLNDIEGAWKDYNMAIALNPKYSDAYNNRAIIKFNRKDYIGSIVDCTMSIYLKENNSNAYNNRASARISLHDYKGAYRDYDKSLQINPYYADGYKNRGIAKYYNKDFKAACEDWHKAAELGNSDAPQLITTYCK